MGAMDAPRLREAALRYGLLFLISVALVAGFWFHGEFYALGLYPLLLVGGFATFLILVALRAVQSGAFARRASGAIPFTRDAGHRVVVGTQTVTVLPVGAPVPEAGSIAEAVVAPMGEPLATIRIRDVRRRLIGDVGDGDAIRAGFDDGEAFRRSWTRGRNWNPREVVVLVEFRREASP